jgi:hypothetical protein
MPEGEIRWGTISGTQESCGAADAASGGRDLNEILAARQSACRTPAHAFMHPLGRRVDGDTI